MRCEMRSLRPLCQGRLKFNSRSRSQPGFTAQNGCFSASSERLLHRREEARGPRPRRRNPKEVRSLFGRFGAPETRRDFLTQTVFIFCFLGRVDDGRSHAAEARECTPGTTPRERQTTRRKAASDTRGWKESILPLRCHPVFCDAASLHWCATDRETKERNPSRQRHETKE